MTPTAFAGTEPAASTSAHTPASTIDAGSDVRMDAAAAPRRAKGLVRLLSAIAALVRIVQNGSYGPPVVFSRVLRNRSHGRALAGAVLATALLAPVSASAFTGQPQIGQFDGTGASAGAFSSVDRLAVSDSSGGVFVLDSIYIDSFDSSGAAATLSGANSSSLPVGGFGGDPDVAVDNSGGTTDGNIYFVSENQDLVYGFDSAGNTLANFPLSVPGDDCGIAVDPGGHVWVSDYNTGAHEYDSAGNPQSGAFSGVGYCHIAFDGAGNLYATQWNGQVEKYNPDGSGGFVADPTTPVLDSGSATDVAADQVTDEVYVAHSDAVDKYASDGTLETTVGSGGLGVAVNSTTGNVYVSDWSSSLVRIYGPYGVYPDVTTGSASGISDTAATLNGTVNPDGAAVTECHFDYGKTAAYGSSAPCAETVGSGSGDVAVHADISGLASPQTYHFRLVAANANGTILGTDTTFATHAKPDVVRPRVLDVSGQSATVGATITPGGLPTTYHVEYGPTAAYGRSTPESDPVGSDQAAHPITETLSGLAPATGYHFRVVATNSLGSTASSDRAFTTHAAAPAPTADSCPNAAYRTGFSASLPDCRAYELVTPADTNGQPPRAGTGQFTTLLSLGSGGLGDTVTTSSVSAGGNSFLFALYGTTLPGFDNGNGVINQYRATRTASGWVASAPTPSFGQMVRPNLGGASADFGYQEFTATPNSGQRGSLDAPAPAFQNWHWLRAPDGTFRPVGEGTVPADPDNDGFDDGYVDDMTALLMWISPSGDRHIIQTYQNRVALTPGAPAKQAVYERTPEGLQLVSIDENGAPLATDTTYDGVSPDGSKIAFYNSTTKKLYVRTAGQTEVVTTGMNDSNISAGIWKTNTQDTTNQPGSDEFGGLTNNRVFYRKAGNLFAYDLQKHEEIEITSSSDSDFVRVAANGSRVFFLSRSQLDGTHGVAGDANLYMWDGTVHFIGTLLQSDTWDASVFKGFSVIGTPGVNAWGGGSGTENPRPANGAQANTNTTRTTPDGREFVFVSGADLTGQNPDNYNQVYRYDSTSGRLDCISCAPDGSDTTGAAALSDRGRLTGTTLDLPNLTEDGSTVFFETSQRLVDTDTDSASSVYEWKNGSLALLSSGQAAGGDGDHLVGATPDGSQVFIATSDPLLPDAQQPGLTGVYSARVDGGFPAATSKAGACDGDSCRTSTSPPPAPAAPSSSTVTGPGNPKPARRTAAPAVGAVKVLSRKQIGTRLSVKLRTPASGRVSLSGHWLRPFHRVFAKRGTHRLTLHLTKSATRRLRAHRRLRLAVRVHFKPKTGRSSSTRFVVTLVRRGRTANHHGTGSNDHRRAA